MFLILLNSSHGVSNEVKISINDFCPLHCTNSRGHWEKNQPGFVYEIYNEIYTKAGFKFIPIKNNFHRGLHSAGEGLVDAISGAIKITTKKELIQILKTYKHTGADYGKLIYSKEPIALYHSSCFFGRESMNWKYQGVNSFKDFKLGSIKNFAYGESIDKYIDTHKKNKEKIEIMNGLNIADRFLEMLILKRVDIILLDKSVGLYAINNSKDNSVKLLGCDDEGKRPLYLGFSSKNSKRSLMLVQIFDEGMKELRKSGKLKLILDKYGLKDWVQ